MRKIVVANRKGGTGKSTTAVHLSSGLAQAGRKTLLIDTDAQGNCSRMLGVDPERGLAQLIDGSVDPEVAVFEARPKLWLLAGSKELAGAARLIARKDFDSQYVLGEALKPYESQYDYAILDTGPGYSIMSVNVLFYGQEIIVPISMESLAVFGYLDFIGELEPIRERSGAYVRYILPTMADGRKGLTADILKQLRERFPAQCCEPIRYAARFGELPMIGATIYENEPTSRAAIDYARLTRRVIEDEQTRELERPI